MDDDFNTARATGVLFDLVRDGNRLLHEARQRTSPAPATITALEETAALLKRLASVLAIDLTSTAAEVSLASGVALEYEVRYGLLQVLALQTTAQGKTSAQLQLDADGNRLRADARLDGLAEGSGDHWDLDADMPALKKLQPDIDDAKRAAESMRQQYSDPAKVEAMRKQAMAMQAAMQAQRPSPERAKQDAGDLQKELGLK